MEKFKRVKLKGMLDFVEVNEDGTIIKHKDKVVKQHAIKSKNRTYGYMAVSINSRSHYVHRIVAEAYIFNKNPLTHKYVIHISSDLSDNNYTNLIWANGKDLRAKSSRKGTVDEIKYRGSSTIPYDDAVTIAKRLDDGEYAKDICREYNVSEMSIARIRKRYCKAKNASPRYDENIKAMVFKLLKTHDAATVAKITGLRYHTIYRWNKNKEKLDVKPNFHY